MSTTERRKSLFTIEPGHPAPLLPRALAIVFDLSAVAMLLSLCVHVPGYFKGLMAIPILGALLLYTHRGETPGMILVGICIRTRDNDVPGFSRGLRRLLAAPFAIPVFLATHFFSISKVMGKDLLEDVSGATVVLDSQEFLHARYLLVLAFSVLFYFMAYDIYNTRFFVSACGVRTPSSTANAEMRNMAVGLESYYIDHGHYPLPDKAGWQRVNEIIPSSGYTPRALTTPVAHQSSLPDDPCRENPDPTKIEAFAYRYATAPYDCWIMASYGPDGDADVDLFSFVDPDQCDCDPDQFYSYLGGAAIIYDPSNGTKSSGDIVRTGP